MNRALSLLQAPVGVMLPLGCIALALLVLRRYRSAAALLGIAIGLLWLLSTPAFADYLTGVLESRYPATPIASSPEADVIIVLGGGALPPATANEPGFPQPDDRLSHAFELFRAGKARAILVSGGERVRRTGIPTDADQMRDLLLRFGVPAGDILMDSNSSATEQNAANSAELMRRNGMRTALLVTSAIHMPRAVAAFHHAGIAIVAAPADFVAPKAGESGLRYWLPNTDALWRGSPAAHEVAGWLYYLLRGWA